MSYIMFFHYSKDRGISHVRLHHQTRLKLLILNFRFEIFKVVNAYFKIQSRSDL
jgi:hypothetical protein